MDKLHVRTKEKIIHVPVTDIINVPTVAGVDIPLTLTGTVIPTDATFKTIVWSIKEDGGTNSSITDGNILNALSTGTVVLTATIINGLGLDIDFEKDFTITVEEGDVGIEEKDLSKVKIFTLSNSVIIKNESKNDYHWVKIYNISGRLVYQGAIIKAETVIPLQVVSGIYNVVLQNRNAARHVSTKVVINH
jgi:hypothetical protein